MVDARAMQQAVYGAPGFEALFGDAGGRLSKGRIRLLELGGGLRG
jgi:hypothetical protein